MGGGGRKIEKGDSKWVTRDCEVVLDCVPAGGVLLRHQAARHQSRRSAHGSLTETDSYYRVN